MSKREFSSIVVFVCILLAVVLCVIAGIAEAGEPDKYLITFYCSCEKCCGDNADGIMASGRAVYNGSVACNIHDLGTELYIQDFGEFTVEDRGAKRLFDNQKHVDIYVDDHELAKRLGRQWKEVIIINKGEQQ